MLAVSNLVMRYGSLTAVDGVSFEVQPGSCFGLLGPNGAGKTTTISIIVGVARAHEGLVMLDGQVINPQSPKVKQRLGFVPQELALYEELTAWDNLRFFGAIYGLGGERLAKRIHEVLEVVDLNDRAREPVSKFSGGMKRRLNIALALLHDPEIVILDEPTVGVDPQSRNAIFENLKSLQALGKTLIYTTHYMEEVEKLCDHVAIMDHGKIVATGTQAELHRLLPSTERLTIELGESFRERAETLGKSVIDITGVAGVEVEGHKLVVDLESLSVAPQILSWLAGNGVTYTSLSSNRLSLEEVFLHLTGRSLRD